MERFKHLFDNIDTRTAFSFVCAGAGTLGSWLFGEWDMTLKILASFMILDYITGVIVAGINKEIDSSIGFKGLLKKILILILVIIAVLLDRLTNSQWVFKTAVCYFFIGNEGWSVLENVGKAGVPLPSKLKDVLAQLKDEKDVNDK